MMKVETLTTAEVAVRSGCTYRQIDYWTRAGILDGYIVKAAAGSGTRRAYKSSVLPPLEIIAELTAATAVNNTASSFLSMAVISRILDNFDDGFTWLSDNVKIVWANE
jgi:DNA-binding transcriptional MerR regulator